jgi:hypothetical protein
MRLSPLWMLLVLAACSTTATTENSDSTAIATDTVATDAEFAEYSEETASRDTTYTETLEVVSAFTGSQIKPTLAYVYSEPGLEVYEKNLSAGSSNHVIGHVDYKTAVTLSQPLVNSTPTDTMRMSGLKGRLVEIVYDGKKGFIFSGYLLNLPVPEHDEIAVYFDEYLHMVQPAVRTRRDCDCDGMFAEENYLYEQGIAITNGSHYESYENTVTFPDSMTLQEVFLFARYFYKSLLKDFPDYPTEPIQKELEDGASMTVEANNGRIIKIIAVTGQGCYEEEGVHLGEKGLQMSANGGC